jgi:hypothetical protein
MFIRAALDYLIKEAETLAWVPGSCPCERLWQGFPQGLCLVVCLSLSDGVSAGNADGSYGRWVKLRMRYAIKTGCGCT